ncbi:MAG: T9SS type A sorting domain-containing protein [Bacteroidales bacterium]|nr:T9SS type A sorting domain-containing protein [Bacteroidales bacterium]
MKAKLFFILFLCSLSVNVWAGPNIVTDRRAVSVRSLYREYYSFADKRWEHRTDHYFIERRDTTIGTHSYGPVFWRADGAYENEVPAGYALREEGDRVYVYDYGTGKEHVFFDFSLKESDILATDWMEETDTRKNPVFRVLAVGDTAIYDSQYNFHYLIVYDTVHQVTDMWLTEVGSVKHGIAWHRDFGRSLDTLETVLCVDGGQIYANPEYLFCYIPQVEPEYVSCKGKLMSVEFPRLNYSVDWIGSPKVLAIKWGELTPMIVVNSRWTSPDDPINIRGVEYMVGDSVEVEGYVSIMRDIRGGLYSFIELETGVPSVPVEKRQKSELKLFPNPAKETVTLSTTGCKLQRVEILDVNGRVLYAATVNGAETFDYNVSQMPSGIYLARVQTPCGVLTEKFSVK